MKPQDKPDELTLHAYVDGQLDPELERVVLRAMESDPDIQEQVTDLRLAKDWMRTGFADSEPPQRPLSNKRGRSGRINAAIAASLAVLAIGFAGGFLGYTTAEHIHVSDILLEDPTRVVLHLDESEPEKFVAVLDYAEALLQREDAAKIQVEVLANAGGIDLMRVGISPVEDRVRQLSRQYENLHFIACANAIKNLRNEGEEALLIDNVHTGKTAVDHIVERLRSGWVYKPANDLAGI